MLPNEMAYIAGAADPSDHHGNHKHIGWFSVLEL